jgi:hypothetical protein
MVLNYLLLPVIFLIGAVTSYEDFRYGKIRNKWIILGLAWGILIHVFFLCWGIFSPYIAEIYKVSFVYILPSYILMVLINSLFSLCAGYLLWYFNLWSAGDAKLFAVFSLLLPLDNYWRTYLSYFPSIVILINTFIPALFFLAGCSFLLIMKNSASFFSSSKNISGFFVSQKDYFRKNYLTIFKTGSGILLFFIVLQIAGQNLNIYLKLPSGIFLVILFFLSMTFQFVQQIFRKTWLIVLFLLIVAGSFLANGSGNLYLKAFSLAGNSLVLMLILFAVSSILSIAFKKDTKTTMPFAFWLFLGLILTLIFKGSLIHFVLNPHVFWQ